MDSGVFVQCWHVGFPCFKIMYECVSFVCPILSLARALSWALEF